MKYFYKMASSLTTRALKRSEIVLHKTFERQFKWSYDYFNKHWFLSFSDYLKAFKLKYKVKNIMNGSFLYNQLKGQYLGYKEYLHFVDKNYTTYLSCVKNAIEYIKNENN